VVVRIIRRQEVEDELSLDELARGAEPELLAHAE